MDQRHGRVALHEGIIGILIGNGEGWMTATRVYK